MTPVLHKALKVVGTIMAVFFGAGLASIGSLYWWWNYSEHQTFATTDPQTGWVITSFCKEDGHSFWGHVRVRGGDRTILEHRFPDINWTADMPQDCGEPHFAVKGILIDKTKRTVTVYFLNRERPPVVISIPSGQSIP